MKTRRPRVIAEETKSGYKQKIISQNYVIRERWNTIPEIMTKHIIICKKTIKE